jgi:hypothetical protein
MVIAGDAGKKGCRRRGVPARSAKPIAPYNKDVNVAAESCLDRETGGPMASSSLKTCAEALAAFT